MWGSLIIPPERGRKFRLFKKEKKMRKYLFAVIIISLICMCSCQQEYKGIDKIMSISLPNGYEPKKNEVRNDKGELISKWYGNDDYSVCIIILSYDGKAVMGSDETLEEWCGSHENIADRIEIQNADSDMFVYPFGMGDDITNRDVIEGVFGYHDYVIMVGMSSHDGGPWLTKKQVKEFYEMAESIELNS